MARLTLQVNGAARDVEIDDPATPLLYVLRNDLALTGTKFGCGLAQCGACTVHLDGQAIRSCSMPVSAAVGRQVTTIEGLGSPERPDPVQAALHRGAGAPVRLLHGGPRHDGAGVPPAVAAAAAAQQNRQPTEPEIKQALAGNLCRCGSHVRVIRAVMRAATAMGGA